MKLATAEKTGLLRMAIVGCDYITSLGLTRLLDQSGLIDVQGNTANASETLTLMATEHIDLVLVDAAIQGADLVQTCRALGQGKASPMVVVMGDVPFDVAEALLFVGVNAILDPCLIVEDLPVALRMIQRGGVIMMNAAARAELLERNKSFDARHRSNCETLNARERRVAQGVAEGLTNVQLASAMHLSEATVKLLISSVMNKLGASNRVQIAVIVTKARVV